MKQAATAAGMATDSAWRQVKASFALNGVELTNDNAAQVGRIIAGDIT